MKSEVSKELQEIGVDIDNIEYIVSQRGNPSDSLYSTEQFRKFMEDTRSIMGLKDSTRRILSGMVSSEAGTSKRRKNKTRKIRKRNRVR